MIVYACINIGVIEEVSNGRTVEREDSISLKYISGERPALSDIHDMCKCEKIDNPDGSRRMGFYL